MRTALICLALFACHSQKAFQGATAADEAACRNVARDVTHDSWGGKFNAAYNDCMTSKGFAAAD